MATLSWMCFNLRRDLCSCTECQVLVLLLEKSKLPGKIISTDSLFSRSSSYKIFKKITKKNVGSYIFLLFDKGDIQFPITNCTKIWVNILYTIIFVRLRSLWICLYSWKEVCKKSPEIKREVRNHLQELTRIIIYIIPRKINWKMCGLPSDPFSHMSMDVGKIIPFTWTYLLIINI